MKITITSRRVEITQPLKEYIHTKVNKISRFKGNINEAHVILSVEKYRQIAEIYLTGNGFTLSSTEETADMYLSIDGAIDKLERQAKKLKKRIIDSKRSGHVKGSIPAQPEEEIPVDENQSKIVKVDAFVAKPMSLNEALMQLDFSGDDIIMFRNSRSDEINVIYRRADGDIGFLEPDY